MSDETGEDMKEMGAAIVEDLNKAVDYVLAVSAFDTSDKRIRSVCANAIASAIRFSKQQGGHVTLPGQTEVVRVARIMHEAKTWEEAKERLRKAFEGRRPETIIAKRYAWMEWKPVHFELPDFELVGVRGVAQVRKPVAEPPAPVEPAPEVKPALPTDTLKIMHDEIVGLKDEMKKLTELMWLLAEGNLTQKDGKFYKMVEIKR